MPIQYRIDHDEGLIYTTWEGDVHAEDLWNHWQTYLRDPVVMTLRRSLVDVRGANILFKGDELSDLIKTLVTPTLKGKDWILAIVVASPVQYGLSRQFHVFADHFSRDRIFHDYLAAKMWLLQQERDEDDQP
ncbi:MAG TPA: hypothetical protein VMH83_03480 [Candidatus Acidoferrum sp.]|nr:hypothetical protein [Candidatus Acidoferrum sp.]